MHLADWHVESGEFELLVGKSPKEIVLSEKVVVKSTTELPFVVHRNTTVGDLFANPKVAPLAKELIMKAQEGSPFVQAKEDEGEFSEMMEAMMKYMPLRALSNFSNGAFTEEMLQDMIKQINDVVKESVELS